MLPSSLKLRKVKSVVTLRECSLASHDGSALVTWLYTGLNRNTKDRSQPTVLILFRKVSADGTLGDFVRRTVPLVALGQIRLGSIWQNDRCTAEIAYTSKIFSLNFTRGRWHFTSFQQACDSNRKLPYPQEIYPLLYPKDQNWFIEFELPNGGRLLIPCVEFFARCYGRSAELKRILATYTWDGRGDTATSRIILPIDVPEEPGRWQVRIPKKLVNDDAVFLAHAKYDEFTKYASKRIHAQIQAHFESRASKPAFISVSPWFEGPAEMCVEGIPFDGNSFLALRVRGMSDPSGNLIVRERENPNDAENPAPDGSPEAWAGIPERRLVEPPKTIDLTGDDAPDQGEGSTEILDPDFIILGQPRPVIHKRRLQATTKRGPSRGPTDVTTVSGGEASGTGKGVGRASIHAKVAFESYGMLHDMWAAMLSLEKKPDNVVQSVAWFTFADGFSSNAQPSLIALEPFDEEDEVSSKVRNFPYLDASLPSLRGILVVRIMTPEGPVYIVEIKRRPRKVAAEDGTVKDSEEPFQGLVFKLDNEDLLKPWLRTVASRIRHVRGVVRNLTGECPGTADSFSHQLPRNLPDGQLPCESIVLGALSKVMDDN